MSSQDSTDAPAGPGRVEVPWVRLHRENGARISRPTRDEIAAVVKLMSDEMGQKLKADEVIFAALRRAARDSGGLAAEIRRVQAGRYSVRPRDVKQ